MRRWMLLSAILLGACSSEPSGGGGARDATSGAHDAAPVGTDAMSAVDAHAMDAVSSPSDASPSSDSGVDLDSGAAAMDATSSGGTDGGGDRPDTGESGMLQYWFTCGDPSCHGHTPMSIPLCTAAQTPGQPCTVKDEECDPVDNCNVTVICETSDPTMQPGGCPRSQRAVKQDLQYLDQKQLDAYAREVLGIRLATYRYREQTPADPARLGFIIEDRGHGPEVLPNGAQVDVYGYTSLAVAALQVQAKRIAELEAQLAKLEKRLQALERAGALPAKSSRSR